MAQMGYECEVVQFWGYSVVHQHIDHGFLRTMIDQSAARYIDWSPTHWIIIMLPIKIAGV